MKKDAIIKKFEKKGYKITSALTGEFFAKKNQTVYKGKSLNDLHNSCFGKKW